MRPGHPYPQQLQIARHCEQRSNQLQAFDLSILGLTKGHVARVKRIESLNVQSKHVAQVACAFMAAARLVNLIQSFRTAGIAVIAQDGNVFCQLESTRADACSGRLLWKKGNPGND
jgi:hypothetical protein